MPIPGGVGVKGARPALVHLQEGMGLPGHPQEGLMQLQGGTGPPGQHQEGLAMDI